jgi:hypothetical protein
LYDGRQRLSVWLITRPPSPNWFWSQTVVVGNGVGEMLKQSRCAVGLVIGVITVPILFLVGTQMLLGAPTVTETRPLENWSCTWTAPGGANEPETRVTGRVGEAHRGSRHAHRHSDLIGDTPGAGGPVVRA